jgi:cysteine desulfurase/selenocysteine lyase
MPSDLNDTNSHPVSAFNVTDIRRQFPIFGNWHPEKPLIYLDNAATTQKPQSVLDAIMHYYTVDCSNVNRAAHSLSERATVSYEKSRTKVRKFINAASDREIVFVRGATEGINLVAQTYGRNNIGSGDEILITAMEHHSNIVPWQLLCEEKGARLRIVPITEKGELSIEEFENCISPQTRLTAVTYVSNALGTINPVKEIVRIAHGHGVPVLIDGAQAVSHFQVDVRDLDCDFFVFSGHKMYGPTGIGVLYGRENLLDAMPPYQGGGDMIRSVTYEKTVFNSLPYKFEAGTQNIAGAIGLGTAVDFLDSIGMSAIVRHETALMNFCTSALESVETLKIIGSAKEKTGVISFVMEGLHPHDIATILDEEGIAVRAGHHCAQPVMDFYGLPATTRVSFGLYNTVEEVDALIHGLESVREVFS